MKLENISIQRSFKEHPPLQNKMIEARNYYQNNGRFKSNIIVDENNTLIDGYITYLLCHEIGIDEYPVKSMNYKISPTIYVFGYHPEDANRKEYVWRLRKDRATGENYQCEIEAGDVVPVLTKMGSANIIVTKVEQWNMPPRTGTIKVCTLPNGYRKNF